MHYEVTHLIVQASEDETRSILSRAIKYIERRGIAKFFSVALFKFLMRLERSVLQTIYDFIGFFDIFDLTKFDLKIVDVCPKVSKSGLVYRYSQQDIKNIKKLNLDLLVRTGKGTWRILTITQNGVYHFMCRQRYK